MRFSHPGMAITVARTIAELRNISIDDVLAACYKNTRLMYAIWVAHTDDDHFAVYLSLLAGWSQYFKIFTLFLALESFWKRNSVLKVLKLNVIGSQKSFSGPGKVSETRFAWKFWNLMSESLESPWVSVVQNHCDCDVKIVLIKCYECLMWCGKISSEWVWKRFSKVSEKFEFFA